MDVSTIRVCRYAIKIGAYKVENDQIDTDRAMGQIISQVANVTTISIGSAFALWILWEVRDYRRRNTRIEQIYHSRPRPETIIRPALLYLTRGGQQIRVFYGNEIWYHMAKTEIRWVPRMPPLQWHDALIDATSPSRLKIVAISRDSVGSRRALMTEFFPTAIADLILSYMYPELVKGRRWRRKQT